MIEGLKIKFFEEAADLINDLEEALLDLRVNRDDKSSINRIFRALHTLKGSGSMFGFHVISDFTHDLESLFDLLRNGQLRLNDEMLSLTLHSVDLIRALLQGEEKEEAGMQAEIEEMTGKIVEWTGQERSLDKRLADAEREASDVLSDEEIHYRVYFKPGKEILKFGNNPVYLIDELLSLGTGELRFNSGDIPCLEELDVFACYAGWEIALSSKHSVAGIQEVFMFVQDQSEIRIEIEVPSKSGITPSPDSRVESPSRPKTIASGMQTIRVSSTKLDQLMDLVSEIVTSQAQLDLMALKTNNSELIVITESLHKLSRQLRDTAFDICMVPFQSVVNRFQRMVYDLGEEMGKKIRFHTEGTDTELDKTIIENILDPLMHLLRNCVDHGLESPEARVAAGKPEEGNIWVKAYHAGSNVVLEVSDDGHGIDREKILAKAIQKGIIRPEARPGDDTIMELIFAPGFSTAASLSNVSGRGVGLDVVKEKIAGLHGKININSTPGKGTTVTIRLPLVLSIIDGLLMQVAGELMIVGMENIKSIIVVDSEKVVHAYQELIEIENEKLPLFDLRKEFFPGSPYPGKMELIIVEYLDRKAVIAVDKVIGEQQAVIKPITKIMNRSDFFSGATILGDGSVSLVLDIHQMIQELTR